NALLLLGEDARPALRAAYDRGLAPPIAVEVERLLAAVETDSSTPPEPRWPDDGDQLAWSTLLDDTDPVQRRRAAWALAQRDPAWRVPAAVGVLARPGALGGREGWALTLAASPTRWSADDDAEPQARLEGWARDRREGPDHRCLAVAALGAREPQTRRGASAPWASVASDPDPRVRACAAVALGRYGDAGTVAALLLDDHARVRAAAALALSVVSPRRLARTTVARLAQLSVDDPDGAVRAAASFARDRAQADTASSASPGMFAIRVEPFTWRDPPGWIEVALDEQRLWLPTMGHARWRWALVPGMAEATANRPVEAFEARSLPGAAR
ncbi:MAG: HEAT repeat domain-containing protein, partial [Deltaproteobacteria bacterium]|nr:HEAT repeat domain-containing protein [Deltaproteobacteria bacterium]